MPHHIKTNCAYKMVLFDFDGTISDDFNLVLSIINKDPKKFGIDGITESEAQSLKDRSILYIIREFKLHLFMVPFYISRVQKAMKKEIQATKPFEGLGEIFNLIKEQNVILGIVTNNSKSTVTKFLKANNLHQFDFIYSYPWLFGKHRKINKILQNYKIASSETIYIGDTVQDVLASKKSGVVSIAVTWGFNSPKVLAQATPDYLAQTPNELRRIIERLIS